MAGNSPARFAALACFQNQNNMALYTIRYSTRKGGSGMTTVSTIQEVRSLIMKNYYRRTEARAEVNKDGENITIGEAYKKDGNWQWYVDMEA